MIIYTYAAGRFWWHGGGIFVNFKLWIAVFMAMSGNLFAQGYGTAHYFEPAFAVSHDGIGKVMYARGEGDTFAVMAEPAPLWREVAKVLDWSVDRALYFLSEEYTATGTYTPLDEDDLWVWDWIELTIVFEEGGVRIAHLAPLLP